MYVDTFNAAALLCWGTIDGQLVDISEVEVTKLLCEPLLTNPTLPPKLFYLVQSEWGVYRCRCEGYGEESILICRPKFVASFYCA